VFIRGIPVWKDVTEVKLSRSSKRRQARRRSSKRRKQSDLSAVNRDTEPPELGTPSSHQHYMFSAAGGGLTVGSRLHQAGRKPSFTAERKRELQQSLEQWARTQLKRPLGKQAVTFIRALLAQAENERVMDSTIRTHIVTPVWKRLFPRAN
jgi:hypothetical protein